MRNHQPRYALLPFFVLCSLFTVHYSVLAATEDDASWDPVKSPPGPEYAESTRKFQGIPGIERAPNGRFWVAWYGGGVGETHDNYVLLATRAPGEEKWSEVKLVIDPDGGGPVRAFDPCLWLDPLGRLWLFWAQEGGSRPNLDPLGRPWLFSAQEGGSRSVVWAIVAEDPGLEHPTWSRQRKISDGVLMNKPLVLSSGEWLLPVADWGSAESAGVKSSTDQGKTWKHLGAASVPEEKQRSADEHMIVERRDGSLWMLVRTGYGIGESTSTDRGKTWSDVAPSSIQHPTARFFIRRLASGKLLLVKHGPIEHRTWRSHMTAYLSDDDGRTWSGGLLLDEREYVSYPDGVQAPDGTIHLVYDYHRRRDKEVLLATFREEDVAAGALVSSQGRLRILINKATGVSTGPESREGSIYATLDNFMLFRDKGLEVVDDPLAEGGKAVRQPCTSGAWGLQWRGCFPQNMNPFKRHRLWVRMRADKTGDEGPAANVGIYHTSEKYYPIQRGIPAKDVPTDRYRWIDLGRFTTSEGYVWVAPVESESVQFIYVDKMAYAWDPDPEPHPEWENSLEPQGIPGPELTLASWQKSLYRIVLSATPTTQEEKAAYDLSMWLNILGKAQFPIVREGDDFVPSGKEISIGRTELALQAALPELQVDLEDGGYAIAVRDERLYLLGGKRRGLINAVYALLEEDLGCRWYVDDAHVIPWAYVLRRKVAPRVYVPPLKHYRDPYYTCSQVGTWSLRNRTLGPDGRIVQPRKWGGGPKAAFGFRHTFNNIISRTESFEDHPEYFSEVNGKRTPRQLCLTNPDVLKITIDLALGSLKKDPDVRVVDVSPNDGAGVCECENCKPINDAEGTDMGTLLIFVNAVADAIRDDYPDARVTTLAYLNTKMPPKTIRPRDNVFIWLCTDDHNWSKGLLFIWETEKFQTALKEWKKIGTNMIIWDYPIYHHSFMVPLPNMPVVTDNMRWYVKHGVTGIYHQGEHCPTRGADRELMRSWVWAKQLWDLSYPTRDLVRDFNYGFYGKAAEPMQQYDDMLWQMWERLHSVGPEKYVKLHSGFENFGYCLMKTPNFIEDASRVFAQAEKLAGNDTRLLSRVELAKLPIMRLALERGPGSDKEGYLAMVDDFERIARQHNVTNVMSGLRGPYLDEVLKTWRDVVSGD